MTTLSRELLAEIVRISGGDEDAAAQLARRWQEVIRESHERAERIRRQVVESLCRCRSPREPFDRGRCSRCYGRPPVQEVGR